MSSVLAAHMREIKPSGTKAATQRAVALKEAGRRVVVLSQGEPDFDTPAPIRAAAIAAIEAGKTRYTPVAGVVALREAIIARLLADHGLDYDLDQITVGCGAKQVLFNAFLATLDLTSEVIIPAPCWVSYPDMVKLARGRPVIVETKPQNGFKLTPAELEAAITPQTKWLLLNSPNNPTGAVYTREELQALGAVLAGYPDVWVMSDDIYGKLLYTEAPFATFAAAVPAMKDRTLLIDGVSKASAMTGWRVGYGAGPKELISAINTIQGQTTSHTSSISQYAAIEALAGDQQHVSDFAAVFRERRDFVIAMLADAPGISLQVPQGAFYVFLDCAGLIGKRTADGVVITSDDDLALYILEEAGVAAVSGSAFLCSPYLRLSFASSKEELQAACAGIVRACARLN